MPKMPDAALESPRYVASKRLALALGVCGTLFLFVAFYLAVHSSQKHLAYLQDHIAHVEAEIERANLPDPEHQELKRALAEMEGAGKVLLEVSQLVAAHDVDWPRVAAAIRAYNPHDIALDTVSQEARFIKLTGRAATDVAVIAYARHLEGTGTFAQVLVQAINRVPQPFVPHAEPTPRGQLNSTLSATPSPSPATVACLGDAYEPDDQIPPLIPLQQAVARLFCPDFDIDRVRFVAKAGRFYQVSTSNLAPGVDTFLVVRVGDQGYTHDDRHPGDLSSLVVFQAPAGQDTEVFVEIINRGQYGPESTYTLLVQEIVPVSTLTATPMPSPMPTLTPTAYTPTAAVPTATATSTRLPIPTATYDLRDAQEPDDHQPRELQVGVAYTYNFYPENDIDRAVFVTRPNYRYRVYTYGLALDVDTVLSVRMGNAIYGNRNCCVGERRSEVAFIGNGGPAYILVTNAGRYGPGQTYKLMIEELPPGATLTPSPQPSPPEALQPAPGTNATVQPTLDVRDAYEPDDIHPVAILPGETLRRTFYPVDDIDRFAFQAFGGEMYRLYTHDLAPYVQPAMHVLVDAERYDAEAIDNLGNVELTFRVPGQGEKHVLVVLSNRGAFGPGQWYRLTLERLTSSAIIERQSPSRHRGPGLAAYALASKRTPTVPISPGQSVVFEILLELNAD